MDIFSLLWVIAACVVLVSGFARGTAGFGGGVMRLPFLVLFLATKDAVVLNLFLGFVSQIILLPQVLRELRVAKIVPLLLGSVVGIPVGVYIITIVPSSVLKIIIGGLVICFAIALSLGLQVRFRRQRLASGIFGGLGGMISSSASIGGPPVALFMHSQHWEKREIYSCFTVYFAFQSGCSLAALYLGGIVHSEVVVAALSLTPFLAVGLLIGRLIFSRMKGSTFRNVSIGMAVIAAIAAILSATGLLAI